MGDIISDKMIGWVCVIIGTLVVIGIVKRLIEGRTAVKTTGRIVNMIPYRTTAGRHGGISYHVIVAYEAEGRSYRSYLPYYDASMFLGKEIPITYQKDCPRKIHEGTKMGIIVSLLISLIFILVGAHMNGWLEPILKYLAQFV